MKFLFDKKSISAFVILLVLFAGCTDYNDLNLEEVDSGSADYSNYVAVGNNLTAGFQHSALYRSGQEYSFPKLIARQLRIDESFDQPLISDPGIGGRIELTSLNPLGTTVTGSRGLPVNQEDKPFKNLGIPGALLVDYLNPNNQGQLQERSTNPQHPAFNPFYSFVLPDGELTKDAPNIHSQVSVQDPSFITFSLGNNDILGYVTSGGHSTYTDVGIFQNLYQASIQTLATTTDASVVTLNIPNVTSIPFVFIVNATLIDEGTLSVDQQTGVIELAQADTPIWIQRTDPNNPGTVQDTVQMRAPVPGQFAGDFFLLSAQSQLEELFSQGVGLSQQNPIRSRLVLDSGELTQAETLVAQYNGIIENTTASAGFGLVDINSIFNTVIENFQSNGGGYDAVDLTLQPVPGSLFSFDGVHPTNRGSAVIANETIEVMNETFGSSVDQIDISDIPEGLPAN